MVTDHYQHVRHHPSVDDLAAWAQQANAVLIGIDNLPGAVPLETYDLPRNGLFLFGRRARPVLSQAVMPPMSCCRSPSSARLARSTPGPRPPLPCTRGYAGTCSISASVRRKPRLELVAERLLVIGADAAGMTAASQARKRRRDPDDLSILAFDRGRFASYSACGSRTGLPVISSTVPTS